MGSYTVPVLTNFSTTVPVFNTTISLSGRYFAKTVRKDMYQREKMVSVAKTHWDDRQPAETSGIPVRQAGSPGRSIRCPAPAGNRCPLRLSYFIDRNMFIDGNAVPNTHRTSDQGTPEDCHRSGTCPTVRKTERINGIFNKFV